MSTRLASRSTGSVGFGSTSSGGASTTDGPIGADGGEGAAATGATGSAAGGGAGAGRCATVTAGATGATGAERSRAACTAESSAAMKSRAVGSAIAIGSSPLTISRSPEYDPPARRIIVTSEPIIEPRACSSKVLESSAGRGAIARTLSIQCCSFAASISCGRANASRNPRPTKSSTALALVPRTHTR